MESLSQFFEYMNHVYFRYVVLRNWDGLPYDVKVGPHSDLDILVYDKNHFHEIFGNKVKQVYAPPRVQHKVFIKNSYVLADIRYLGDSYYPYDFENQILKNRTWNKLGFWTPDPVHHRIALAYHAVHHKGFIDPTYRKWLGNVKLIDLIDALKKSSIGWEKPLDHTVGCFNSYTKGATSVVSSGKDSVKKKQYRFNNYDLIKNEKNVLSKLSSKHFPKIISESDGEIEIEHCGKSLSPENLPKNWEQQLLKILKELIQNKIVHRDIKIENLMVKNEVIKLIDFGWASCNGEKLQNYPDLLGYPNKAPWGFDDSFSMGKVIKQIKGRLNENTRFGKR